MIQKTITDICRGGGSANIVKNGPNRLKQQPSYCNDGGARRVLEPKREGKNAATVHAQGVSRVPELARFITGLWNSPPKHFPMDRRSRETPAQPQGHLPACQSR